jgi:hypothetical protein
MSAAVNTHHPEIATAQRHGIRPQVWVVACGKAKRDAATAARDLYTGDLTAKQIAFATSRGSMFGGEVPVLIASARYGLVDVDTVLDPYDVTLADFDADQLRLWTELVAAQAVERGIDQAQVHLLAGGRYDAALRQAFAKVYNGFTTDNVWRTRSAFMGERKAAFARVARREAA